MKVYLCLHSFRRTIPTNRYLLIYILIRFDWESIWKWRNKRSLFLDAAYVRVLQIGILSRPEFQLQLRVFWHVWWAEISHSHSKLHKLKTVQGFKFLVRCQCTNIKQYQDIINLESRLEESSSSMHFRGARLLISVQMHVIIAQLKQGSMSKEQYFSVCTMLN